LWESTTLPPTRFRLQKPIEPHHRKTSHGNTKPLDKHIANIQIPLNATESAVGGGCDSHEELFPLTNRYN
jgi:hypothetical protein